MERAWVDLWWELKKGQVAPSKRQPLEMVLKSPGARYFDCSPQSFLGQWKAICNRIRFLGPVTLSPPNSCQKAGHMPGECLRSLGSWVASALDPWAYFYTARRAHICYRTKKEWKEVSRPGHLDFKAKCPGPRSAGSMHYFLLKVAHPLSLLMI